MENQNKSIRLFVDISLLKGMCKESQKRFFSLFENKFTVIIIAACDEISQSDSVLYGKRRNYFDELKDRNDNFFPGIYLLSQVLTNKIPHFRKEYMVYTINTGEEILSDSIDSIFNSRELLLSRNQKNEKTLLKRKKRWILIFEWIKWINKKRLLSKKERLARETKKLEKSLYGKRCEIEEIDRKL